eukprot:1159216-Pelagomonas_calceolata.AAC.2
MEARGALAKAFVPAEVRGAARFGRKLKGLVTQGVCVSEEVHSRRMAECATGMCYKYDVKGWLIVPIMAECAACTHYGKVCHMHTLRQSVPHAHTVAQCAACADYCTACLQRSKSYPFVLMLCPAKRG